LSDDFSTSFLGGLRSEFDEGYVLPPVFTSLLAVADNIRTRYIKYEIDVEQAANLFKELIVKDTNGYEWTIGASTGSWYRRQINEKKWLSSSPPIGVEPDNVDISFDGLIHNTSDFENKNTSGLRIEKFLDSLDENSNDKDWLLDEWNKFEEEVRNLENNNLFQISSAPLEQSNDDLPKSISNSPDDNLIEQPNELELPKDDSFSIDDFFVKPEDRDQSQKIDDNNLYDNDTNYLDKPPHS
jgi:hypothetical protein